MVGEAKNSSAGDEVNKNHELDQDLMASKLPDSESSSSAQIDHPDAAASSLNMSDQENGGEAGIDSGGQLGEDEIEGLFSNSLGQGFEDALSKDWDKLMDFDTENLTAKSLKKIPKKTSVVESDKGVEVVVDKETKPSDGGKKKRSTKKKSKEEETASADPIEEEEPLLMPKKRGRKVTKTKKPALKVKETEEEDLVELTAEEASLSKVPRWYFVQVKPGCENMVSTSIRNLAQSGEGDDIVDVMVPMTTTLRLNKAGNSIHREERFFPGYILVMMTMNRYSYGNVQRVTHIQHFMGDPNMEKKKGQPFRPPLPVSDAEMKKVFARIDKDPEEVTRSESEMGFKLGDAVRVISGSMEGSKGKVVEVKPDLELVRCSLMVFGHKTTVELQGNQIEIYDEEQDIAQEQERVERISQEENLAREAKGRSRINATFGKVDYKDAKVASSADDLAKLLSDDINDDWDPMMDVFPKRESERSSNAKRGQIDLGDGDDHGFVGADTVDNEGFVGAPTDGNDKFASEEGWEAAKPKKLSNDSGGKGVGLISSDDELDGFLKGEEEEELWSLQPNENVDWKKTRKDSKEDETALNEDTSKDEMAELLSVGESEGKMDEELAKVLEEVDNDLDVEGDDMSFDDLAESDDELDEEDLKEIKDLEKQIAEEMNPTIKKGTPTEELEFDEAYGVAFDPKSLELDDIGTESIIKIEGEEDFVEIDLMDKGPYPDIDYDAKVEKDKLRKAAQKSSKKTPGKKPT